MKFGFLSGIGEITPSIFSGLDAVNKARIFINLYNCCAGRELKIPLVYAYSGLNLEEIFLKRIDDLCEFKNPSRSKISSFCIASNAVICAYKSGKFDAVPPVAVSPKHPAAKLIVMLKSQNGICFDADIMFSQFVYDKIRLRHQDKEVVLNGGVISVKQGGKNLLSVMPSFKRVSFDDMRNLNDDIDRAVCALGHECEMVYIVCPRNEEFRRHVEVRHCFARGCIKLVPYTIISKIF